jgi:phage regulator Rha-like protein
MNEIVEKDINIEDMIYDISGKQVMLDSDLAKLYECTNGTKDVNKAVGRNLERFPKDFYFQLTAEEYSSLRFQNGTLKEGRGQHRKYTPYVFTEQGVAMLASVLKTKVAAEISVRIMRAFVAMKKYISKDLIENDTVLVNHEKRILKLEELLDKLSEKQSLNSIIYEGQIYDAYSVLIDILNEANNSIIIIDNYANKELFDILRDYDKNIIVISKNLSEVLIKKYSNQYSNIRFINNNDFHDRYIILDNKTVYSSGMSFKDIGKKYTFIYKVVEQFFVDDLIGRVVEIVSNGNVIES